MARGRKVGSLIKCITVRDFELMQGIAKTGVTSKYDATKIIGLSEKRLKNLEKEGYIQSKSIVARGTSAINTYYLNDKGKAYVKLNTNINRCYRSNERQIEHDLKLSSIYYSLEREQRKTWTNENDLIEKYKLDNPHKELNTMVDATFSSNGITVAVEVTTRNYTKEQIQEKYNIANEIGCKEVIKIEA
jgi:DNA-binding PadR family transcriptional regulator